MTSWHYTEADKAILERSILPFLPDKIFDAHAHLFAHSHFPEGVPDGYANTPSQVGLAEYQSYIDWLHPDKRTEAGLFFGLAFNGDRQANNDFVSREVEQAPEGFKAFGHMLVSPDMTAAFIQQQVEQGGFVGLKPYHTVARGDGPTWQATIGTYLPEQQVELANDLGLGITLHMVRDRALADPVNQKAIRYYCQTYPNIRLILAHAARGFNPWHTIEGIESLRGLGNVWFDTSAVTEAGAFEAIVETMGHERLLYGTDFPVSHLCGRCVAIGDSFHWFYAEAMALEEKHVGLEPVLIGLESLRSLCLAFHRLKLNDGQIGDIFYYNAAKLFLI